MDEAEDAGRGCSGLEQESGRETEKMTAKERKLLYGALLVIKSAICHPCTYNKCDCDNCSYSAAIKELADWEYGMTVGDE